MFGIIFISGSTVIPPPTKLATSISNQYISYYCCRWCYHYIEKMVGGPSFIFDLVRACVYPIRQQIGQLTNLISNCCCYITVSRSNTKIKVFSRVWPKLLLLAMSSNLSSRAKWRKEPVLRRPGPLLYYHHSLHSHMTIGQYTVVILCSIVVGMGVSTAELTYHFSSSPSSQWYQSFTSMAVQSRYFIPFPRLVFFFSLSSTQLSFLVYFIILPPRNGRSFFFSASIVIS